MENSNYVSLHPDNPKFEFLNVPEGWKVKYDKIKYSFDREKRSD